MFGKAKSKAELQQLKNEYLANLQVEIENANTLEKKIRKPDEAPPVPPQYKTEEEIRSDVRQIENELVQTIMNDIGFGYSKAVESVSKLNTDEKIKLLALYPQFKATLAKDAVKSRLRLLDPAFINLRMKQFLSQSDKSYGTANLAGVPASVEDLTEMMPTSGDITSLLQLLSQQNMKDAIAMSGKENLKSIYEYLNKYQQIFPSIQEVNAIKTRLPYFSKMALVRSLGELIIQYNILTKQDIQDIITFAMENLVSAPQNIGGFISSKLGSAGVKDLDYFEKNWKETLASNGGTNLPKTSDLEGLEEFDLDVNSQMSSTIFPIGGEEGTLPRRKKSVKPTADEGMSSLAQSSLSTDITTLGLIADDEGIKELAEEIREYLSRLPRARRLRIEEEIFKPIGEKLLSDYGYEDIGDVDEENQKEIAGELLTLFKDALDKNVEGNIGMTIEEINEGNDEDVLNYPFMMEEREDADAFRDLFEEAKNMPQKTKEQKALERQRNTLQQMEMARVGRREGKQMGMEDVNVSNIGREPVLQPSRGALISSVFEGLEQAVDEGLDPDVIFEEAQDRVNALTQFFKTKKLGLNELQKILDEIYTLANLNYGLPLKLPKKLDRFGMDTYNGVARMIRDEVIRPLIYGYEEGGNIAFPATPYDPNLQRLFNPASYPEFEDEFIGDLQGFGMRKPKRQGRKSREDERLAMEVKGLKNKMGKGMCGSGSRISVKKLIGKGIEVEQQPTYRKLGKYVMHYPHLMNNVFNVKYPSLGSIPAIKPKTISDDYKDFMIDVFETGKMNERLFNNLDDEEKSHFHKVCKGAGLLELFKLKRGETDEEKEDLDRFNLLKGSYVAGNNSESVIRELRGLITKFIHEGRITKNEGLSMLMEIK